MLFNSAENAFFGRKSRQTLLAGVAGGALLLTSGFALVSAENAGGLDAIFAAEDANPCNGVDEATGLPAADDAAEETGCDAAANESVEDTDIDLGGDRYSNQNDTLSAEDEQALSTLSDEEAQEIATLFDEEDSADNTAEVGTTASTDVAAQEDAPAETANSDETDMGLEAGGTDMAAGPEAGDDEEATGTNTADSGDDGSFDSAQAGSDGANTTGTIQGTGSLIAVGIGDGLSNAVNDPTSLDSLADIVVGTDPENGNKDNVVQVTALGGVTDGYLSVSVLEALNGDTDDPLGQVLAVDADNAPSGLGTTPSIDGIAEVNLGDDPDGQSFNIVQVDAFDDNFLPDGSAGLANVAVGDGLDEGFGSLVGLSIADTSNNGEHDDLANIALGGSFDPLAAPLLPLTDGINGLGVTLGEGLAPILAPLADALP